MLSKLTLKRAPIILLLFITLSIAQIANASGPPVLFSKFLEVGKSQNAEAETWEKQLEDFINEIKARGHKDEHKLSLEVFKQVQKTFLRNYKQYSGFEEIFSSGSFDCLTGTSLYALIFDALKLDYEIFETRYHIFILLHTNRGTVLIESTDANNGFVLSKQLVSERIEAYTKLNASAEADKFAFEFSNEVLRKISLQELVGLMHFNRAIKFYNSGRLVESSTSLELAAEFYQSQRIEDLLNILALSVINSALDEEQKKSCLRKFQNILSTQKFAAIN